MREIKRSRKSRERVLAWAVALITVIVLLTWLCPPDISPVTAGALATVTGLLTVAISYCQRSIDREDEREDRLWRVREAIKNGMDED